ncbi:EthD domain-containing protein [bacterium]|nr:EthD domain-containing protein [bacterium]
MRKLVQSLAIEMENIIQSRDFDGMAELWFDDWASLLNAP